MNEQTNMHITELAIPETLIIMQQLLNTCK